MPTRWFAIKSFAVTTLGVVLTASPALAVSPAMAPPVRMAVQTGAMLWNYCRHAADEGQPDACRTYVAVVSNGVLNVSEPRARLYCLPEEL